MSEVLETDGLKAGQLVFPDGNNTVRKGVKASENILVGDPITFDSNGFAQKGSDTVGGQTEGYGVAREDGNNSSGADGDIFIQIVLNSTFVGFVMGGVVNPFSKVKLDSTFKAVVNTAPANSALNAIFDDTEVEAGLDAVRDHAELNFGRYYGLHKEEKNPTASIDTDIGVLRLGSD